MNHLFFFNWINLCYNFYSNGGVLLAASSEWEWSIRMFKKNIPMLLHHDHPSLCYHQIKLFRKSFYKRSIEIMVWFFFGIRKLYAYASLVITSYYDQVLMKSTGVYKSPVQRGNKGLWSFFVLVICQNPGVLPYTKEL